MLEAAAKQHTLSSLDAAVKVKAITPAIPQTMSSQDNKIMETKNFQEKNAMQHIATPVHPSHLSIQLGKHGNTTLGAPTRRTSCASCRRFSSPVSFVQRRKCNAKKMTKQLEKNGAL